MKEEHQKIIKLIELYLEKNPDLRFTQALFNLNINQKPNSPVQLFDGVLRDNYGDKDLNVLQRISDQIKQFEN